MKKAATKNLWIEYKLHGSSKVREQLILQYVPLVKYVVDKILDRMPPGASQDDLVSFGIFGLIDAVEKYDYNRGVKFQTYAIPRIRGAILDELRTHDHVSRSLRQKAKLLEKAYAETESRLGRAAKDEEIAQTLSITVEEFTKLVSEVSKIPLISLDELVVKDGDRTTTIGEELEDKQILNPEIATELREVERTLAKGIENLSEQERSVIALYYYDGMTLKETSVVLSLSESRVSQIRAKAVLRLRALLSHLHEPFAEGAELHENASQAISENQFPTHL